MKMLQEYWASTVIFIGIFSQCMSSPISEHENSRFLLFRNKFVIVEAVLNIIVQATAFSRVFFYIKVSKVKEQ